MAKNNQIALRPSYWASVSGGKDSLYMLNLILNNLDKYPLDGVMHFELEIDYPFIKNVIDEMERRCTAAGIMFYRLKPVRTWRELYDRYGYPSRLARWCNDKYKLTAERKMRDFLLEQGKYLVKYIGFCADEVKRFREDLYDRGQHVRQIYPLAECGIEEEAIWRWAREQPIFNVYYKFNKRCGCMACPMARRNDLAYLLTYYPEEYEKFMALAHNTEENLHIKTGNGNGVWTGGLTAVKMDEIIRRKYIPLQELPVPAEQVKFSDI